LISPGRIGLPTDNLVEAMCAKEIGRCNVEVVVIGAGPAGARCAELLAAAGREVLMIEKDSYAGETNVCGGLLDASFASELHRPASRVKEIDRWICHFGSKVTEIKTRKISFARNRFDKYLAQRAVSEGAGLLNSTRAIAAKADSEGISILTLNPKSGKKEAIRSNLAIFADGPTTLAQRVFGIGFRWNPTNVAVGAIYEFEYDGSGDSYELFFDNTISPWGYGWVIPKSDHLNIGVTCLNSKMTGRVKEYLDHFVHGEAVASWKFEYRKRRRFAAAPIPLAPAQMFSSDRVLVVGDAAGMVDAIWGGGMGHCLRGAECAAKVASEAVSHNRYDANFLSKYDLLWKQTEDYAILRKSKLLSDAALPLQAIWPNIYRHFVDFGVSHPRLQHLLQMRQEYGKPLSALDAKITSTKYA
jgi:geranylgeranyl reductase family protein